MCYLAKCITFFLVFSFKNQLWIIVVRCLSRVHRDEHRSHHRLWAASSSSGPFDMVLTSSRCLRLISRGMRRHFVCACVFFSSSSSSSFSSSSVFRAAFANGMKIVTFASSMCEGGALQRRRRIWCHEIAEWSVHHAPHKLTVLTPHFERCVRGISLCFFLKLFVLHQFSRIYKIVARSCFAYCKGDVITLVCFHVYF